MKIFISALERTSVSLKDHTINEFYVGKRVPKTFVEGTLYCVTGRCSKRGMARRLTADKKARANGTLRVGRLFV